MLHDLPSLRRNLLRWYDTNARELPWRGEGCTPYRVLVSEFMLQQTQVATALPYFERFLAALPTVEALSQADEAVVLRLWQGLGYYSRARRLQATARVIVERYNSLVPRDVPALLALPGVGRYTAGAIASIAFNVPAPIVDGNVVRVLTRLHAIQDDPAQPAVQRQLWSLAEAAVDPKRPGDFNSSLMELGATVCTSRSPRCLTCPVRRHCAAKAAGLEETIPPPKQTRQLPRVERHVWRVETDDNRLLVEQRPTSGRWASMWQFISRPAGSPPPVELDGVRSLGTISHALTHRKYQFHVSRARLVGQVPDAFVAADEQALDKLAMPKPHVRIRYMT